MTAQTSLQGSTLGGFSGELLLVGAGKMGAAMLEGWLARGLAPERVTVREPNPRPEVEALARRGLRLNPSTSSREPAAVAVIAVKPQAAPDVLAALAPFLGPQSLVLSIMAGRTIAFLARAVPGAPAIIRAMPNTPAAIGRGITVAVANGAVTEPQRKLAHELLAATGVVEWVEEEALLDAVTAVSGSGPAYVFLLAEALARAGEAVGLPAGLAARLASATVAGSGELLHRSSDPPARLRENVTSPGGTTQAALEVLTGPEGLDALMARAVQAAVKRSRQLAG